MWWWNRVSESSCLQRPRTIDDQFLLDVMISIFPPASAMKLLVAGNTSEFMCSRHLHCSRRSDASASRTRRFLSDIIHFVLSLSLGMPKQILSSSKDRPNQPPTSKDRPNQPPTKQTNEQNKRKRFTWELSFPSSGWSWPTRQSRGWHFLRVVEYC